LNNAGKIIRPAYKSVSMHRDYISLAEREENIDKDETNINMI